MKLIYIAGPYRASTPWQIEQNIRAAEDVAVRVHKAGMFAVCPHANSRHMEGVADDAHFLAGTMEMMRRCDAVLLVPGWQRSEGSRAEEAEAAALGIPVFGSMGESHEAGITPGAAIDRPIELLIEWREACELVASRTHRVARSMRTRRVKDTTRPLASAHARRSAPGD